MAEADGREDSTSTRDSVEDGSLLSQLELNDDDQHGCMSRSQAWNLYVSHFLSTWNMRTYEFAAIIFTASAYPDTLLASSVRGIIRTLAAMCFSSAVGRWIDRASDRLKTLTTTIIVNRISVILACLLWYIIVDDGPSVVVNTFQPDHASRNALFAVILTGGVFETLSATANTLSMERDWIVVAASPPGKPYDLTTLNAIMRRIDLTCKLISPLVISVIISVFGTTTGVITVGSMSALSVGLEYYSAKKVWKSNSKIREFKHQHQSIAQPPDSRTSTDIRFCAAFITSYAHDLKLYLSSIVCIPSLALSLLHLSALAYSASLITFLLNVGITLNTIAIARAVGSIVEVSSTVVTPIGVDRLSHAKNHGLFYEQIGSEIELGSEPFEVSPSSKGNEVGLFRAGLWGLTWQMTNLLPVILSLWSMSSGHTGLLTSITLFFFLSSSRLGLWIYDLTTQQLTQTMTGPDQRSQFAGVENSFVSLFELLQNIAIIVLSRPEQFKWVTLMSLSAVVLSTIMYASWVWKMRGHLVHWDSIMKSCECIKLRVAL